jgi:hypothetical protein
VADDLGFVRRGDLEGDLGDGLVEDLTSRAPRDRALVHAVETAEEAGQELEVAAAGALLPSLRGKEDEGRTPDAMAFEPRIDESVGA